jgi:hypothetical protein
MNKFYIAGQVGPLDEQRGELAGSQSGRNSDVGDLTNAASGVAVAIGMDVAGGDNNKKDRHNTQGSGEDAGRIPVWTIFLVLLRHFTYPDAALTPDGRQWLPASQRAAP